MENRVAEDNDCIPVSTLPYKYRLIFPDYACFNKIQSKIFPDIVNTDGSVVVAAPTGSGKTVVFELAILKHLIDQDAKRVPEYKDFKMIYIAPMKSLCSERVCDWRQRFGLLDLAITLVTGENENVQLSDLRNFNVIVTTPEKWDSLTRQWRNYRTFVDSIVLFMIDEVHLLNEPVRGPTLEAIVSRMKTINQSNCSVRFVAASATIPNVQDVAEWLATLGRPCKHFEFGEETRPVKLTKHVFGYPTRSGKPDFKFDITLNYKLQNIIMQHAKGKPTLVFCSTRKSVEMAAVQIAKSLSINLTIEQRQMLHTAAIRISLPQCRDSLKYGIGMHHAGLLSEDRRLIEQLFRESQLPVLVTTSTLAMGVNLPAHLVIIKNTRHYQNGEYNDYTESSLLQMMGRAGRPQFDTEAVAVIMTSLEDKAKYVRLIQCTQPLESKLKLELTEHLNSEIVLRTLTDIDVAMRWLTTTFLFIRARKNPGHYNLPPGLSEMETNHKLLELCHIEINRLTRYGMISVDENVCITPTPVGELMARYYMNFETMKNFTQVQGNEGLPQLLTLIVQSKEFDGMYLRQSEKRALNLMNSPKNTQRIRFTMVGRVSTIQMKLNCLIQASLGCIVVNEPALIMDTEKTVKIAEKIAKCLCDYLNDSTHFKVVLSAITLAKCLRVKLWENSIYVARQLPGIGNMRARSLANAGKTSFKLLLEANPRNLDSIVNRRVGDQLQEIIQHLPRYHMEVSEVEIDLATSKIQIKITLQNHQDLQDTLSLNPMNYMVLLVGNEETNKLLHKEKISHNIMIEQPVLVRKLDLIFTKHDQHTISVHLISETWVGFDCYEKIVLFPKPGSSAPTPSTSHQTPIKNAPKKVRSNLNQQPIESYFKNTKPTGNIKSRLSLKQTCNKNISSRNETPVQTSTSIPDNASVASDVSSSAEELARIFNNEEEKLLEEAASLLIEDDLWLTRNKTSFEQLACRKESAEHIANEVTQQKFQIGDIFDMETLDQSENSQRNSTSETSDNSSNALRKSRFSIFDIYDCSEFTTPSNSPTLTTACETAATNSWPKTNASASHNDCHNIVQKTSESRHASRQNFVPAERLNTAMSYFPNQKPITIIQNVQIMPSAPTEQPPGDGPHGPQYGAEPCSYVYVDPNQMRPPPDGGGQHTEYVVVDNGYTAPSSGVNVSVEFTDGNYNMFGGEGSFVSTVPASFLEYANSQQSRQIPTVHHNIHVDISNGSVGHATMSSGFDPRSPPQPPAAEAEAFYAGGDAWTEEGRAHMDNQFNNNYFGQMSYSQQPHVVPTMTPNAYASPPQYVVMNPNTASMPYYDAGPEEMQGACYLPEPPQTRVEIPVHPYPNMFCPDPLQQNDVDSSSGFFEETTFRTNDSLWNGNPLLPSARIVSPQPRTNWFNVQSRARSMFADTDFLPRGDMNDPMFGQDNDDDNYPYGDESNDSGADQPDEASEVEEAQERDDASDRNEFESDEERPEEAFPGENEDSQLDLFPQRGESSTETSQNIKPGDQAGGNHDSFQSAGQFQTVQIYEQMQYTNNVQQIDYAGNATGFSPANNTAVNFAGSFSQGNIHGAIAKPYPRQPMPGPSQPRESPMPNIPTVKIEPADDDYYGSALSVRSPVQINMGPQLCVPARPDTPSPVQQAQVAFEMIDPQRNYRSEFAKRYNESMIMNTSRYRPVNVAPLARRAFDFENTPSAIRNYAYSPKRMPRQVNDENIHRPQPVYPQFPRARESTFEPGPSHSRFPTPVPEVPPSDMPSTSSGRKKPKKRLAWRSPLVQVQNENQNASYSSSTLNVYEETLNSAGAAAATDNHDDNENYSSTNRSVVLNSTSQNASSEYLETISVEERLTFNCNLNLLFDAGSADDENSNNSYY